MEEEIKRIIEKQRRFFHDDNTKSYEFRKKQLNIFKDIVNKHEDEIYSAIEEDLGRSPANSFIGEILTLKGEISYSIRNLKKLMKGKTVWTPFSNMPGKSEIIPEPYGNTLIISPWNYPFQLAFIPALSSISAGNTVIIKPSEYSIKTSELIKKLTDKYFDPKVLYTIIGGIEESQLLLKQKFDYIFYTGGINGGKAVAKSAAENLTPITLELGGKSPCIVGHLKNLTSTAKRIAWGKFYNAGQTCVAPDYLLVHKDIKDELIENIKQEIKNFYGENPKESKDFAKIINERHFERIVNLIQGEKIIEGGIFDKEQKYISPTLLVKISWKSKIMQEEIFGPVLPIIEYEHEEEFIDEIKKRDKPLAMYIFTEDKKFKNRILTSLSSGGVCVNDTIMHISSTSLPFGGVGASGMGSYHGKAGFETFSHNRSIMSKGLGLDLAMKFPPYGDFANNLKKLFEFFNS